MFTGIYLLALITGCQGVIAIPRVWAEGAVRKVAIYACYGIGDVKCYT